MARPVTVVDEVFPLIPPGLIVQFPEGNPLNTTDPVETAHVGCVIVPTTGTDGVWGWTFTEILVTGEIQPLALLAVRVCDPAATGVITPPG